MSKYNQVIYANINESNSWTLDEYLKQGGYSVWKQILSDQSNKTSEWVIEEVKKSGLRGRGGAGFPTGLKWSFMPKNDDQKYIVCNSDESEPGTCHDRDILKYNPHALVEGMAIAGYAIGATVGYNYVRGEFMLECYPRIEAAVKDAYHAGLLGINVLDSGINFDLYNFLGAGAYICGEETALLESLEGKQGKPRFKPPFPANYGLYGKPTTVNNTQTLATIPKILEKGAKWYADFGTEKSPGTLIFSISGHVNKPGNYELPLGISFEEVIELAGRAIQRDPKETQYFKKVLNSETMVLRYWAAQGLLMLSIEGLLNTSLLSNFNSEINPNIKIILAETIGHAENTDLATEYLLKFLNNNLDNRIILQALNSLTYISPRSDLVLPNISKFKDSSDPYIRNASKYLYLNLIEEYEPSSKVFMFNPM